MIIHLNEIPPEGLYLQVDESKKELAEALQDLVSNNSFKTNINILPIGDGFDVSGSIKTTRTLQCARCTGKFELPVNEKFHEILLAGSKEKRKFDDSMSNMSDPDIFVSEIRSNDYEIGELLHEIIALAEPPKALCKEECVGLCFSCGVDLNSESCDCANKKNVSSSPFSALRDLKLN